MAPSWLAVRLVHLPPKVRILDGSPEENTAVKMETEIRRGRALKLFFEQAPDEINPAIFRFHQLFGFHLTHTN